MGNDSDATQKIIAKWKDVPNQSEFIKYHRKFVEFLPELQALHHAISQTYEAYKAIDVSWSNESLEPLSDKEWEAAVKELQGMYDKGLNLWSEESIKKIRQLTKDRIVVFWDLNGVAISRSSELAVVQGGYTTSEINPYLDDQIKAFNDKFGDKIMHIVLSNAGSGKLENHLDFIENMDRIGLKQKFHLFLTGYNDERVLFDNDRQKSVSLDYQVAVITSGAPARTAMMNAFSVDFGNKYVFPLAPDASALGIIDDTYFSVNRIPDIEKWQVFVNEWPGPKHGYANVDEDYPYLAKPESVVIKYIEINKANGKLADVN